MNLFSRTAVFAGALSLASCLVVAAEVDADAAKALLKKNDCTKCHAIDKKKDGPPYKEVASKYKGKPDSEAKLYKHVTSKPMVKIDGKEEEHKVIKGEEGEIRNVIRFILSV